MRNYICKQVTQSMESHYQATNLIEFYGECTPLIASVKHNQICEKPAEGGSYLVNRSVGSYRYYFVTMTYGFWLATDTVSFIRLSHVLHKKQDLTVFSNRTSFCENM